MTKRHKHISATDFADLAERNDKLTIIDVRTEAEVDNEYFEGCLNLPLQNITAATIESKMVGNTKIAFINAFIFRQFGYMLTLVLYQTRYHFRRNQ